jgi:hypothetical protein
VPTSVLLAVLAAAGLLALAPALTRRFDATERVAAERATSTARVLSRSRRRRTVPGLVPVRPPSSIPAAQRRAASRGFPGSPVATGSRSVSGSRGGVAGASRNAGASRGGVAGRRSPSPRRIARPAVRRRALPTALHRRRRVLVALIALNLVELGGVLLVGPGFWIGFSVSFTVLLADLVYLRRRAVVAARRRRARQRRLAWIAAEQAAVRRQQARRAAQRRAAVRHAAAERESARREAARRSVEVVERYARRATPGS